MRYLLVLLLLAVSTVAVGRDVSPFWPRPVVLIEVPPPNKFLPALHAFRATTNDLAPGPPWYYDDPGEAEAALIAERAKPKGTCHYSGIGISDDGKPWRVQFAWFYKDKHLNYHYDCIDVNGNPYSGNASAGMVLASLTGCANIDDELRSLIPGFPHNVFRSPYDPMACVERQLRDHPPCCDDGFGTSPGDGGNPIFFPVGRKRQTEPWYVAPGGSRLGLQGYFEEHLATPFRPSPVGWNWAHSFNRWLVDGGNPSTARHTVGISEPNGHWTWFRLVSGSTYVSMYSPGDVLTKTPVGSSYEWHRRKANDELEVYNAKGQNVRLESREGRALTLTYGVARGRLWTVTDDSGRQLVFSYGSNDQLSRVDLPDGTALTFDYALVLNGRPHLTTVHLQDGSTRKYDYNGSGQLTTVTDESGSVFLTITYNSYGKAIATTLPGGVKRYAYTAASAYGGQQFAGNEGVSNSYDLVTPLGTTVRITAQNVNGTARPVAVSAPCPGCGVDFAAASYDVYGQTTSRTDWDGSKTCFAYDSRGLGTARVEGLVAADVCATALVTLPARAGVRKLSTRWHPTLRLPAKTAEPNKVTYYTYNGDGVSCAPASARGVLCRRLERPTTDATGQAGLYPVELTAGQQTWTYTYDARGQELTAVDPAGKRITTTYYPNGDVLSITNAAGDKWTIDKYDGAGRPLVMSDERGPTTLTYWPRGWLHTWSDADGTTRYDVDKVGQLTKMTLPDGNYLVYTNDAAHRLLEVKSNTGTRLTYQLDLASRLVHVTKTDAGGTVTILTPDVPIDASAPRTQGLEDWPIKVHGFWCGPNWTGGFEREYGPDMSDQEFPPQDDLDRCCYTHDICFWECRCEPDNQCYAGRRRECMRKCDRKLATCIEKTGRDPKRYAMWQWFHSGRPFPGPDARTCPE